MKYVIIFAIGAMAATAHAHQASAQTTEGAFDGFKVGSTYSRQVDMVHQTLPGTAGRFDREGADFGYRAFLGFDRTIGERFLVGSELGLGFGGDTLRQKIGAQGEAKANPGMTLDASLRAGVLATPRALIYGRVGYSHVKLERDLKTSPTGPALGFGKNEHGLQYGAGVEYAVSHKISLRTEFVRTDFAKGLRRDELRLGAAYRF